MKNNYYVYEWIRLDTNEPFYVGKGKGKRWKERSRGNEEFKKIVNEVSCVVNILHDNLDEETAFGLEVWYTIEYRDVFGYELCNINDGKYLSQEAKQRLSSIRIKRGVAKGEKNPNFGKKGDFSPIKGRKHSEEELNKMIKNSKLRVGVKCIELNREFLSLTQCEKEMQRDYGIKIARRQLAKRLNGEIKTDWYGEIEINGVMTKLHWEYC